MDIGWMGPVALIILFVLVAGFLILLLWAALYAGVKNVIRAERAKDERAKTEAMQRHFDA